MLFPTTFRTTDLTKKTNSRYFQSKRLNTAYRYCLMMTPFMLSRLGRTHALSSLSKTAFRRGITSAPVLARGKNSPSIKRKDILRISALGLGLGAAQYNFGRADNFFEHKFKTNKSPDDLADFYGTEEFMEIFCVFPFLVQLLMRGASFDDNGTIHAWGLLGPGELEVSIEFDEKSIDTSGDGEPDTLAWFNKREQFHDVAPKFLGGSTLWQMTQNFGYHLLDDGTCEIYHQGEQFSGLFPIRFLFQLHAKYVIWATEKYINSQDFGSEDRETELEETRQNIPLHVFREFLDGLKMDVERVKETTLEKEKQERIDVTIQRLKTVSNKMDHSTSLPRLRTVKSHKTKVVQSHLLLEDMETKDVIQSAMKEIGSEKNKASEPVKNMNNLARRVTLATRRANSSSSSDRMD